MTRESVKKKYIRIIREYKEIVDYYEDLAPYLSKEYFMVKVCKNLNVSRRTFFRALSMERELEREKPFLLDE